MHDILKTLAIISPNENAYSETFIQAHKKLPFNIKYYYDGFLPLKLLGADDLLKFSFCERLKKKINKKFTLREHALINSLRREKVDVILAEYGPSACAVLAIASFLRLPMVVHFHGYDASQYSVVEKYRAAYKKIFEYCSAVIVVSEKMKNDILALGCEAGKIVLNPYGPGELFFQNKPSYNNRRFISVGRFVEKKAPQITIEAFKKVVDRHPDATLTMVGDGPLLEDCRRKAIEYNMESNIIFAGVKSPADVLVLFENSIAFVQHSVIAANGDSEGTPVAVLEAQAASLPVIATYHAGIPDVVIHNVTGLLCTEHDAVAMGENMLHILNEPRLAQSMGGKGKERVAMNFTLEKHLGVLTDIIKHL